MATDTVSTNPVSKLDKQKLPSGLRKCFQALVDRKQVNLDMCVLKLMLKYELQVDVDNIDSNLAEILPYMLIVYIRNWPGWQKSKEYYSGKLVYREWFLRFRQYIIVRLNYLIKNGYQQVLNEIEKEKAEQEKLRLSTKDLTHKGTQTDFLAPKGVAPFTISVECPARMLRTIVFSAKDDDIMLNHHPETAWTDIGILELVNWPHVGIEFVSSELTFHRYNRSECRRFINFTSCSLNIEQKDFIEEANVTKTPRTCYTLNRLFLYAKQYIEILNKVEDLPQSKLEAIAVVLEEFLKDVEELNQDSTIATNTTILFNIGKCAFVRNKKVNKAKTLQLGNNLDVGYCETFIPKMEILLDSFTAVQDFSTFDVTFKHLNEVNLMLEEKQDVSAHIPKLTFKCLFCDIGYDNHEELIKHFEEMHGMEPHFVCTKCLTFLTISSLARIRWRHVCSKDLKHLS